MIIPVKRLLHAFPQQAVPIPGQKPVPFTAPDHLDHVPVGATETAFQFLDDLAVATHRAVQALEITVDDQDQVVQSLPGGDVQCAQHLGLIHLAVADETPYLAAVGRFQPAMFQVFRETGLVDRHR